MARRLTELRFPCYHTVMKRITASKLCTGYAAGMVSVFLLLVSPKGYLNISETKAIAFYGMTGLFLLLLLPMLRGEPRRGRMTMPQLLLCAYGILTLVSAFCSPWPATALLGAGRFDGAVTILLCCLLFVALSRYGRREPLLLWVAAAAITVYCIVCVLQLLEKNPLGLYPGEYRWSGREQAYNGAFLGFTGNADLSAAVLAMGFALFWAGALHRRQLWFLIPALGCLAVLLWSGMRGGILGALGSLVLLPWFRLRQKQARLYYGLALFLLLGLGVFVIWLLPLPGTLGEAHALLRGQVEDSFGSGRIFIWRRSLSLLPERLLLGGGADTLGLRLNEAFTRVQDNGTTLRRTIDCAHCEYLNILLNQGLLSLCCYLAALGCTVVRALRQRDQTSALLLPPLMAYGIQALFGIAMPGSTGLFWVCWGLLESAREAPGVDGSELTNAGDCAKL